MKHPEGFVCSACKRVLSTDKAVKTHGKSGQRYYSLCLECNNEKVKARFRRRSLARLQAEVHTWSDAKLANHIDWLNDQLEVLLEEGSRRITKRPRGRPPRAAASALRQ